MENENRRRNIVVGVGFILSFFAIPHLIDDFLYNIPEEFGLTNQTAQLFAGLFTVILILFLVLAARDLKIGYIGMHHRGISCTCGDPKTYPVDPQTGTILEWKVLGDLDPWSNCIRYCSGNRIRRGHSYFQQVILKSYEFG